MGGFIEDEGKTSAYLSTDLKNSLHGQLSRVSADLSGLDINGKVISEMKKRVGGDYIVGDIMNNDIFQRVDSEFDVILLLDVIEHLDDFRSALGNIANMLRPGGKLAISTANAYCLDSIIKMLFGYESVHEEHTCYFSYLTIKRLLEMNGYYLENFHFTIQNRRPRGTIANRIGFSTMRLLSRAMPQFAQGIFAVASRNHRDAGGDFAPVEGDPDGARKVHLPG